MIVESGSIALISGGPAANLGKIVFVFGCPDDPRLPRVGGGGTVWDVQMIATPPVGLDGEEYLRIGIGEDWLMPIPVPKDLACHEGTFDLCKALCERPVLARRLTLVSVHSR